MNKQDYASFVNVLNSTAEYLGKPNLSEIQISVYWSLLEQISLEDVKRGVTLHLSDPQTGQFMPKAADIRRQLRLGDEESPTAAWGKVIKAIERHGPYRRLAFDDATIHAALEAVSWYALCHATYEQLAFRQRDFEDAYRANIGSMHYPAVICALPNNSKPEDVIFIGDEANARRVMAIGHVTQYRLDRPSGPQDIRAITLGWSVQGEPA